MYEPSEKSLIQLKEIKDIVNNFRYDKIYAIEKFNKYIKDLYLEEAFKIKFKYRFIIIPKTIIRKIINKLNQLDPNILYLLLTVDNSRIRSYTKEFLNEMQK